MEGDSLLEVHAAGTAALRDGVLAYLDLDTITGTEFNRDPGDLSGLRESIRQNGLITPLACAPDGRLLAGRRRFAVMRELGWKRAPFIVIEPKTKAHALKIAIDENVERKNYTDPEYAGLIKQYHEQRQFEEFEKSAGPLPINDHIEKSLLDTVWSQQDTADELGISRPTVSIAIKVAELVEEHPEWAGDKGQVILRRAKLEDQIAHLADCDRPEGLFDVIVCDPPWPYEGEYDPDHLREAPPYPSKSIEEIKALMVPAAEDCVLWLWCINRLLHDAFHVLEAWGFEPKTVLTWHKDHFGTGRWLRGQTEHCILAIRGSPPWRLTNQSTLLKGPLREHSRKPDEFYALADSLCFGRKLDMFSREKREGWAQWGDECDRF